MATNWVTSLLAWFEINQRQMPWRDDPQPYKVWISEVMLQQTQVDTVIPYFNRFMDRFPTVEVLASADQEQVLKLWEGLGYYSRARNLHKAAQMVVNDLSGVVPNTYEDLQTLSGIGPYCAAAIASIAFEKPVPVVDGNVLRVFARFWGVADDIRHQKVRDQFFDRLSPFIQDVKPSQFNQAIMELGALVCSPTSPKCDQCPLQSDCVAFQTKQVNELPYKSKAKPVPHYDIAVGIVWHQQKLLIGKRKQDQMLGGLWEFPGGKIKKGETEANAVKREILEETGLDVEVGKKYGTVNHAYTHFKITLHVFHCSSCSSAAKALSTDEVRWVSKEDLQDLPFPKANIEIFKFL